MQLKVKKFRSALLFLFMGVLVVGMYFVVSSDLVSVNLDKDDKSELSRNVSKIQVKLAVVDLEGVQNTFEIKTDSGVNAFDMLKNYDEEKEDFSFAYSEDPGFGAYVTAFNGVQAEKNEFWEFRVNGTQSDSGISAYEVKNGDTLTFKLTKFN